MKMEALKSRGRWRQICWQSIVRSLERSAREAYFLPKDHPDKQKNVDKMWLLWCSAQSPLFGKSRMSAFERYFTKEKALHEEVYNSYYRLSSDPQVCEQILKEFGVDFVHGHIINGHVPVRQRMEKIQLRQMGSYT